MNTDNFKIEIDENGDKVIVVTDHKDEVVKLHYPEKKECSSSCAYMRFDEEHETVLKRITDFEAALDIARSNQFRFYSTISKWWIDDDDVYDEESGECVENSMAAFMRSMITSFANAGCIYIDLIYIEDQRLGNERIVAIDDKHTVVRKGSINYSVEYPLSKTMFYYKDSCKNEIHSGKVNAVVIRQVAGKKEEIVYEMNTGAKVPEALMATAEMAHKWIDAQ